MKKQSRREFLSGALSSLGVLSVSLWTPPKAFAFLGARVLRRKTTATPDNLYVWGYNFNDALGVNAPDRVSSPIMLSSAQNWTSISVGQAATHLVKSSGSLWTVGTDILSTGVLGTGAAGGIISSPVQIGSGSWASVATNGFSSLGVMQDGTLWSWGGNRNQTLGYSTNSWCVTSPIFITAATAGNFDIKKAHGAILDASNQAYVWGMNTSAQYGVGNFTNLSSTIRVNTSTWTKIATGTATTAGIKSDGTLWVWGNHVDGSVPDGGAANSYTSTPVMIGALTTWTHINLGYDFGVGRLSDGTMMGFGYNQYGATGVGDTGGVHALSPKLISGTNWASVACGDAHFLALKGDGTLWGCGCNSDGQIGNLSSTNVSTPVAVGSSTWSQVSAGMFHSLGIRTNGNLFSWGYNNNGALGTSNTVSRTSPVRVGLSTWLACSAGNDTSIAVRADGTLWAWGYVGEWYSVSKLSSPVQIGSDTDWASVKCGDGTHLAQKTNGNVYGFGLAARDIWDNINNSSSPPVFMLAQNTEAIISTPVQVGSATNWRSVFIGAQQSFGIKTDGTLWQWGWIIYDFTNYYSYCRYSTPVQVGVATTWQKITSCGANILGLQSDGTIYGWGSGQPGLGINVNNSNGDTSTPILITSPATAWIDIATAADCGLAIANDGTLYSWGYAEAVRGKTGGTVPLTPVSTATTGWSKVASGTFHALGIKSNGTLWSWGDNPDGPLGIGNTSTRSTPVQVGSGTDWHAVFAGGRKSMGTKAT